MKRHKEDKTRLHQWFKLNFGGLVVGILFYCLALTPSLLPTPPVLAGFIAGLGFAIGYGLGLCVSWVWRKVIKYEPPRRVRKPAWGTLLAAGPLLMIAYGVWNASWQNDVRQLIGEQTLAGHHVIIIISVAFVAAALFITLARLLRNATHIVSTFASRFVPARIDAAIGVIVVGLVLLWLYNCVLAKTFVAVSNNVYSKSNSQTDAGIHKPKSNLRSGGPASLVPWETLGREGRNFVTGGPQQEQLAELNEHRPKEQIRAYVGIESAETIAERAALAVKELERTGAFDREVIAVMTATGTGWIEPQSADALEYMYNGDSALVSLQYSYLPSWMSFLVDQDRATTAGRELFNAVYAKWRELPTDNRPKLVAYGLSLGSFGAQAAFSGVEDLQNRTDGALFLGTPSFSQPWGYFTQSRKHGSPQWQPIYKNGGIVRFGAQAHDLSKPNTPWAQPRIAYMQHASDPVVWWSYDLILHKPDWLKEPRGPDVSPNMQWYPFITFAQVTVNQLFATSVPNGHGHNYGDSIADAWASVVSPPAWSAQKAARLRAIINAYPAKN